MTELSECSGRGYTNMLPSSLFYALLPARKLEGERYPLSPSSERRLSAARFFSIHDMGPNKPSPSRIFVIFTRFCKVQTRASEEQKFQLQSVETGRRTVRAQRNCDTTSVSEDLSPRRILYKSQNNSKIIMSFSLSLVSVASSLSSSASPRRLATYPRGRIVSCLNRTAVLSSIESKNQSAQWSFWDPTGVVLFAQGSSHCTPPFLPPSLDKHL